MSITKKISVLFATLATVMTFCSTQANATVIVDFQFDAGITYTGQFAGNDSNSNGILNLNELTAFSLSNFPALDVTGLFDFGSYVIASNTWNHDAQGWGQPNWAYFSFDYNGSQGGTYSANTSNVTRISTSIVRNDVPEPATMALLGLGMLGFAAARRRNKL